MSGEPTLEDERIAAENAEFWIQKYEEYGHAAQQIREMAPEPFDILDMLDGAENIVREAHNLGVENGLWVPNEHISEHRLSGDFWDTIRMDCYQKIGEEVVKCISHQSK